MFNKGALALLTDYGGDSSDDEVPGTRVSTKRIHKDDEDDDDHQRKRFERLPVPKFTINNPEDVTDDPSQHEGRVRNFPHERGNWATYVYIPYESNEGLRKLLSAIATSALSEHLELKFFDDFHLSLTKTVILKHHWIDSFVTTLRDSLAYFTKFIVMFSCLEVYSNEEKTRSFIGLKIRSGHDSLLKLVQCLDNCLEEFKLSKFYENPSFHVSIAWCLGDCTEKLKSLLPNLNSYLEELMVEYSQENWYIYVEDLICRSGNKQFQFHLR